MATKDFSSIQERRVAAELNWHVVSGSGARPCSPGDIESDQWLGECKTHTERNKPIVFYLDVWHKLKTEAMFRRKNPVLIVDDGSQQINKTWCLFMYATGSSISTPNQVDNKSTKSIRVTDDKFKNCINSTTLGFEKVCVAPLQIFSSYFRSYGC